VKLGISMPILNQPYEKFAELAAIADSAGFESVWDYEFFRNPFMIHATCAGATTRITHATGIATACSRTPFEMANAAADLDELTSGRALIGLANGAAMWTDVFNGADVSHPLPRIKEYIELMRLHWKHFSDGQPFEYQGRFYKAASPAFNPWGARQLARPQIPIYLSVVRPRMLRLAGEIADGALGYLGSPRYFAEVYRPNVAAGARAAGRDPSEVEIAALIICSVSEDREEAMRRARIQVGNYICFPGADPMVQFEGLSEQRDAIVMKLLAEGPSAFDAIPDEVVKTFAICGSYDEGREQLAHFDGTLDHVILHTPYVPPLQQADSEDAYRNTIAAFGPTLVGASSGSITAEAG
jgi:alkanesulfonate monooxygenase SsuD/methylene tetrahydromethanopterin reductase-like flavin-dependent oxidoreductase (luciferase family)